jgi:hypothetical protein
MNHRDDDNDGPFPKSVFPPSVFPRRIFPWMGENEEENDKKLNLPDWQRKSDADDNN